LHLHGYTPVPCAHIRLNACATVRTTKPTRRAAAAPASAGGVGAFVYSPILPMGLPVPIFPY
jgi:hypothetical protein